jgi:hypothetical protein
MNNQEYSLSVDSRDRNWLSSDTTFDYNFRVSNPNNLGALNKNYNKIKSIHLDTLVLPNFFINMKEVICAKELGLLLNENNEKKTHNPKFCRMSDLNFISVHIDEVNINQNGTNNTLNTSSGIFIIDTTMYRSYTNGSLSYESNNNDITVYSDTNILGKGESNLQNTTNENLIFRNISAKKNFLKVDSSISSLHISLRSPDGNKLQLLNDTLTVSSIGSTLVPSTGTINYNITLTNTFAQNDGENINTTIRTGLFIKDINSTTETNNLVVTSVNTTNFVINKTTTNLTNIPVTIESRKLEIKTNEFFSSDEYRIGDRVIFKKTDTTNIPDDLLSFLERTEGHTIISLYNSNQPSATKNTLYDTIEILPKININNGTVTNNFFERQGNTLAVTGGLKILNLNNQHLINMKIIAS